MKCPTAALYHQHSWLQLLHRSYGFPMVIAALEEDRRVIATCVFMRTKNPFRRCFVSLPFSDYCPPLSFDDEAKRKLLKALKDRPSSDATLEVRGIGAVEGWYCHERFVNWALCMEDGPAILQRGLSANFRRNLRRASQENISVSRGSSEDYLRRFYRLHLLARRKLGLPAQPWRFFKLVGEIFAPSDDLEIWLANRDGRDLAAALLIRAGNRVYYKWGARQPGDDSRANHLLFWNAIEDHCTRSQTLDLGRTDISNTGLMRFKKDLGASAVPMPYSYFPRASGPVSAEALVGARKSVMRLWSVLPLFATRLLGSAVYRYLA